MKESYPDDIMLCFVQSFNGKRDDNKTNRKYQKCDELETNNNASSYVKVSQRKVPSCQVPVIIEGVNTEFNSVELRSKSQKIISRKNLRLTSEENALRNLNEVKRSFSDRFSVIGDVNGKRNSKGVLTIRKTRSTGNFSSGAAAGGCGAPRSAPATPLQLDIHPRQSKHDKNAVKQLSNSVPSVRTSTLSAGSGAGAASDASEGKAPSKSRQKKFLRHFPQVGPDERVLNYYSCALVGDILLQGHLYITKNYFAFYSNVFGYVTKLLIPTASVIRVTKEKMARIIPNAVGVCTRDERHVFGSLLSRDSTYKLMTHVWKAAGVPEILPPPPAQDLRISEADLDVSEYSPEDESSSGGAESVAPPAKRRESESIISAAGGAAVIQPALLTGTVTGPVSGGVTVDVTGGVAALTDGKPLRVLLALALIILTMSATVMGYRLYQLHMYPQEELLSVSGSQVLSELVRWRGKLHARAANELHAFLTTNLLLLSKVRQSLETLSSVILTDMNQHSSRSDVPPDHTTYS